MLETENYIFLQRNLLLDHDLPFAETKSKPVVLLPIIETNNGLELWTDATYQMVQNTLTEFRRIDSTGHFESDDEIGAIFEQMKDTINHLEKITEEN